MAKTSRPGLYTRAPAIPHGRITAKRPPAPWAREILRKRRVFLGHHQIFSCHHNPMWLSPTRIYSNLYKADCRLPGDIDTLSVTLSGRDGPLPSCPAWVTGATDGYTCPERWASSSCGVAGNSAVHPNLPSNAVFFMCQGQASRGLGWWLSGFPGGGDASSFDS